MNSKTLKKLIVFIILVLFLVCFSLFFYKFGFNWIMNYFNIHHSYLLGFIISLFGGLSTVSSYIYLTLIISFVFAGANPILLGIISGLGLAISDIFFFYVSSKGRELIPNGKFQDFLIRLEKKVRSFGDLFTGLFIIFYLLTPLPNDILNITLAFIKYPFKKMVKFIIIGDILYMLIICLFVNIF